jgi:phosphoglucosamine mutase
LYELKDPCIIKYKDIKNAIIKCSISGGKLMARLFGTDGVRGIANEELTAELAYKLGQAGAYVLTSETKHTPKIIIGMDTRVSGPMLEAALISGICSVGAEAICAGVIPTPAIAYLTRHYKADAGIMISASHNSYEYNGIKFFNNEGFKLPDHIEDKIEELVLSEINNIPMPTGKNVGTKCRPLDAEEDYIAFLENSVSHSLKGVKVAIDCANGAAYKVAPHIFEKLGAKTCTINEHPDGININRECGSTHINELKRFTKECNADIGFAFDGDADRVLAVDENGNFIDGDKIMAIIGYNLKQHGKLHKDTIVATVMSNLGLDIMGKKKNINILKTKVGDRYVLEKMKEEGYTLGGEQSGHIIYLDYNTTGDGVLTALQILEIMVARRKKASELAQIMEVMPQVLVNARVKNSVKYNVMDDSEIEKKMNEVKDELGLEGRVLIRASGTEPLVRVMIEGNNQDYIRNKANELAGLIEKKLK